MLACLSHHLSNGTLFVACLLATTVLTFKPDIDDVTLLKPKPPPKPKEDPLQRNLREAESRLDTATQRLQRAETDFHVADRKVREAREALGAVALTD